MKKRYFVAKISFMTMALLLLLSNTAVSQKQCTGSWEGTFMGDFRTILKLNISEENSYTGKIVMFSGSSIIQDDEISKIAINDTRLSFLIEAKESEFKGTFNEDFSELSGHFIFPDGSEHAIALCKKKDEEQSKTTSLQSYINLKEKRCSVEELRSDLIVLMEKLKEFHPQLYSYTCENSLNAALNNTFNELYSEQNLETYFSLIAPLIDMVKCSHTGIRLPAEYQQLAHEYGNYIPVKLVFRNNKAYYIFNYNSSEDEILEGSEVLSINNVPITEITRQLLSFIPAEGNCLTTKYCELNQNFPSYYYLLDNSETYDIEFLSAASKKIVTFQACNYNEADEVQDETGLPVEFFLDSKNEVGIMKVSSFAIRDIGGYIQLMDSLFQSLEESCTPNLVVDLRDNKGGHPIFAAQLFSYLTDKEFTYFQRNPDAEDFEPLYNMMQPSHNGYNGNLYVLINGACLSTTGHLISLLKYHTNALFVGEEPGSSFYCNDFSIQISLPNTGIEVNIPRTTFKTAVSGFVKGESFPVDYYIENTITDLINGNDRYVEFIYDLVEHQNTHP